MEGSEDGAVSYLGMRYVTGGGLLAFPVNPDSNGQREVIRGHSFRSREGVQYDVNAVWPLLAGVRPNDPNVARFMYLFMCVLQWISIYEIHFGSRGYSFEITCNFLSICMRLLRHCTCVCQKFTLLWHFTFPFRCNLQLFAGRSRA